MPTRNKLNDEELKKVTGGINPTTEEADAVARMVQTIDQKLAEWQSKECVSLHENLVRHGLGSELLDPSQKRFNPEY